MALIYKNVVGIEIDGRFVKLVKCNKSGSVVSHNSERIPEGVVVSGKIESPRILTETIKAARKKLKRSVKKASFSITSPDVVIRHLTIPAMDEKSIYSSIELELSGFLPVSTDKYSIDYLFRGEQETEGVKQYLVTAFAVPKDILQLYLDCINDAGFKVIYVDVLENSVEKLHSIFVQKNQKKDKGYVYLHIDHQKTLAGVYADNKLKMSKNMGIGAAKIINDIMQFTEKPTEIAEDIVFNRNILTEGDDFPEERDIIKDYINEVSMETGRLIDFFKNRSKEEVVNTLYLGGSYSCINGIKDYISQRLGMEVFCARDVLSGEFKRICNKDKGIDYSIAYAATLREEGKK